MYTTGCRIFRAATLSETMPATEPSRTQEVWVMQEFKNSKQNHLGIALPKGRLRFYRRDSDGSLQFVGENEIDHTPADETIRRSDRQCL